jgi:hypothetical protein
MNFDSQGATPAGDRCHHVTTLQTCWRIPVDLAETIKELAVERGTRPGRLVTILLQKEVSALRAPITADALANQVHYPAGFPRT